MGDFGYHHQYHNHQCHYTGIKKVYMIPNKVKKYSQKAGGDLFRPLLVPTLMTRVIQSRKMEFKYSQRRTVVQYGNYLRHVREVVDSIPSRFITEVLSC